jgi:hypothetical protein
MRNVAGFILDNMATKPYSYTGQEKYQWGTDKNKML